MQIGEMFLACSRDCSTKTVLECLVDVPSLKVSQRVAPKAFTPEAVDFMENIQDGGVFCFGTWPTLKWQLHRIAETSEAFHPRKLRPEPPQGGCATFHLFQHFMGKSLVVLRI
jgi:hypothetical protein